MISNIDIETAKIINNDLLELGCNGLYYDYILSGYVLNY